MTLPQYPAGTWGQSRREALLPPGPWAALLNGLAGEEPQLPARPRACSSRGVRGQSSPGSKRRWHAWALQGEKG